MATVDRDQLLLDTKAWLPLNTLSDSIILAINETVILRIGDDDIYYPQIRCECLKANATKLMVEHSLNSGGGLKREKVGQVEAEYYNNSTKNPWKEYIDGLYNYVCPLFGYVKPADADVNYSPMTTVEYDNTLTQDFTKDCTCSSEDVTL